MHTRRRPVPLKTGHSYSFDGRSNVRFLIPALVGVLRVLARAHNLVVGVENRDNGLLKVWQRHGDHDRHVAARRTCAIRFVRAGLNVLPARCRLGPPATHAAAASERRRWLNAVLVRDELDLRGQTGS